MSLPPEAEFRACMRVLHEAILSARSACWQPDVNVERVADLMDAVHNIPGLVQKGVSSAEQDLLKSMLLAYERKWADEGPHLRAIYEQALINEL